MGQLTSRKNPRSRKKKLLKKQKKHLLSRFHNLLLLNQLQIQFQNQFGNHLSCHKRKYKPSLLLHLSQHRLKKLTILR